MIGVNLSAATRLLKSYNMALESIRSRGGRSAGRGEVEGLLGVLVPIDRHLRGIPEYTMGANAWSMSRFLRLRHRDDWPAVRDGILSVTAALEGASGRIASLRDMDMQMLGYAADAMDNECESLYREMHCR